MRHRVTIEQDTKTRDNAGGFTDSWGTFATVWASIMPASAHEIYKANKVNMVVTHKVVIRDLPGINAAMRVNFNGRILQIKGITRVEERGVWMNILCEEGTAS